MRRIFILLVLALLAVDAAAQQYPERRQVRKGNRAYEKGNYQDAAGRYMRALSADPSSFEAQYNLGNALHRQEMYDQAAQVQQQAAADSLAAPALIALFAWALYDRRRRLARFGDPATVATLMPDASTGRMKLKFILFTTAVILVILAAARPQFGSKLREQKSEGIEMMLAVDISNSMLAEDFEPNRLERTKYAINKLFDGLEQDRVGVIVFAGDATVQLPITSDYRMAKAFAKRISPSMASVQGTSIGKALSLAEMSFSSGSGDSRVIILITDGEDHEGNVMQAAERAAEQGIRIFTIGIGTPEGAPIEIGGEFIKDEKGDMVVSKLDEKMLQEIARITGGAYIRATKQSIGLDEIVRAINDMEQSELSTVRFEEYNEQFQYLIAVAFALLLVEFWLLDRRNPLLARFNIFREQRTDIDNYNPYNR